MNILKFFPGQPREVQVSLLLQLEQHWDDADVFVITAPTALGKTLISLTIAKWVASQKKFSANLVPSNILLTQLEEATNRQMFTLRKKSHYRCHSFRDELPIEEANCQICYDLHGFHCSQCTYVQKVRQAHKIPYIGVNYYTYMAHKLQRPVVIVDEAHQLVSTVSELNAKKIWVHEYGIPTWVASYGQLLKWIKENPEVETSKKFQTLRDELEFGKLQYVVVRRDELYHGKQRDCILLLPLDTSQMKQVFFPQKKVEKVVLLSATIGEHEVKQLGLSGRRVIYLNADSPIPIDRRPVFIMPIANMALVNQFTSVTKIAKAICTIMDAQGGKGIIHAPYSLAPKIIAEIFKLDPAFAARIFIHGKENKTEVFTEWLSSSADSGKVLIGSGMYEGIDLKGDEFQWQCIVKIPYPSLADPAVRWKAEQEPTFYAWMTIRDVVQASGRICRDPTDYGATYILDKGFSRLYKEHLPLFPKYFIDAVLITEE